MSNDSNKLVQHGKYPKDVMGKKKVKVINDIKEQVKFDVKS